jgi:hypothetical protein
MMTTDTTTTTAPQPRRHTRREARDLMLIAMVEAAEVLAALRPDVDRDDVAVTVCLGTPARVTMTAFVDDEPVILIDQFVQRQESH